MVIINHSKILSDDEINDLLNLLPDKYRNLDVRIEIYDKWFQTLIHSVCQLRLSDWEAITQKDIWGEFNNHYNTIKCFSWRVPKDQYIKVWLLSNLLHELRHKIQTIKFPSKFQENAKRYIKAGNGYSTQWIERDAVKFTRRVLNKFCEEISETLNIEKYYMSTVDNTK